MTTYVSRVVTDGTLPDWYETQLKRRTEQLTALERFIVEYQGLASEHDMEKQFREDLLAVAVEWFNHGRVT